MTPNPQRDYSWAQRMLREGKRVRRRDWPTLPVAPGAFTNYNVSLESKPYWIIWHAWWQYDIDANVKGWGGVIGAIDPDYYPDLGGNGTYYIPTGNDLTATDWEFYEDRLADPAPMEREPEYAPPTPDPSYSWPAYLVAGAFITALMVGAILYFPWR